MAYRLSIAQDPVESVRDCARDQLDGAIASLEQEESDPVEAVHAARKSLKKTRALLRLVRPALPKRAYRAENGALRELAGALSGRRDADVLAATAERLAAHAAGQLPADVFTALRDDLAREAAAAAADEGSRDAVLDGLRSARARVAEWPLERCDWDALVAGAARSYERGREAFAVARIEPSTEHLHEWRKCAKDLWYHARLLEPVWPAVLQAQADEAHALTELLGDDHDLAGLTARVEAPAPLSPAVDADRAELLALIETRRAELIADATRLGRRLYAERPNAFRQRLAGWVRIAVAEAA